MTVIKEHIKALRSFRNQAEMLAVDLAVEEEAAEVARMNREQLSDGEQSDGNKLKPPYSEKYAAFKRKKGLRTDVVTLRLEGDFYKSIKPNKTAPDAFEMESDDGKAKYLIARYGKAVLGLNEDNIDLLAERIRPKMEKRLRAILAL